MRLPRRSMQGNFSTAAQRHAKWSYDHGLRRKLDGLRHALELPNHKIDFIPLLLLYRHQQEHQVCTDRKIRGIVRYDKSVEIFSRPARLQSLCDQRNNVRSERV